MVLTTKSRMSGLMATLLLAVGHVWASAEQSEFLGAMKLLFVTSPGTISCPGGTVTGYPYPSSQGPCTPGSGFHIRGRVHQFQLATTDSRVNGTITMVVNWNWDSSYSGPMWGTFSLVVDSGRVWEGAWTGYWNSSEFKATLSFVGHGTGGDIEGFQLKFDFVGGVVQGAVAGRILNPKGS